MYNEYFGFKETPFAIAPDPRYLYMTAQHREALAHLVYGLNSEGGCILLTGEVGTGKTTICRCLLEQIPAEANVALVLNPKVNEIELLETICDELNIDYPDKNTSGTSNSLKTYTDRIYNFLIENNRKNESTVLIIDEAQNLDSAVLEQLRLLTNLETDKRKLLQIIILGQPELLDILAKTEMRQLAQRITARYHLEPLTKTDIKAYVDHRLAIAGQNIKIFPEKSIHLLFKLSKGIPRLINILCDRALLGAYVENQYTVSPDILKKAAVEVFGELKNVENKQKNTRWLFPTSTITAICALSILLFFNFKQPLLNFTKDTFKTNNKTENNRTIANTTDHTKEASINKNEILKEDIKPKGLILKTSKVANVTPTKKESESSTSPIQAFEKSLITSNSLNFSYATLFDLWDKKYNESSSLTGCSQAEKFSLPCLHKQGNINDLKKLNRPVILKVNNQNGKERYIAITKIVNDIATVYSAGKSYELPLNTINNYWKGEFFLLWKKPEAYTTPFQSGDKGKMTAWLEEHFVNPERTLAGDMYTFALSTEVRQFQKENKLTADGVIGPITIIHLNSKSNTNIPKLINN